MISFDKPKHSSKSISTHLHYAEMMTKHWC